MNTNSRSKGGVDVFMEKYKDHPSIKMIHENVSFEWRFSFKEITESDKKEVSNLNSKKAGTFGNVYLRKYFSILLIFATQYFKVCRTMRYLENSYFPKNSKLTELTPAFREEKSNFCWKLSACQRNSFCFWNFWKNFKVLLMNFCLYISLIGKWKKTLNGKGYTGAVLINLSKAFDTMNHELLIAKLHAYGFSKDALKSIFSYRPDRWQSMINKTFSSQSALLHGGTTEIWYRTNLVQYLS